VLFQAEKDRLKGLFPTPVFADLLDNLTTQIRSFFDNHLKKQKLRLDDEAGFLDEDDFEALFAPLKPLLNIASDDTQQQIDQKLEDNQKIEEENQTTLRERRYRIALAFLPALQQRLARQFIVQTMTARLGADPALVEALLSDARLLGVPQPLLETFAATSERGVNATFFDGAGEELDTSVFSDADTALRDREGNPIQPAGTNRALFEGYLEVPVPGAYRLYVAFEKKDDAAELRFDHLDHLSHPFLTGVAAADHDEIGDGPDEYVELKPGVPYGFTLDVTKPNGGDVRLLVQGETLPKASLAQLTLYPRTTIEQAENALLLLQKVLQLIQALNLSEHEVRYLLTHAADFGDPELDKDLDLSKLPTTRVADDTTDGSKALFGQFLRLAGYARLKRDLAGGTDDLIGVFETDDIDRVYPLIAKLTRREETTVRATARALFTTPAFNDELNLQRLWDALQVVERFGVPVESVVEWTRIVSAAAGSDQRFAIARDLKEVIKARFEQEAWQLVARPIFDRLRRRQRDALVAHVMHQHGFARMEQLYEYFLIDPGMEPVVQTSRIRLAISSLQLFIQRCLINLEQDVPPSVINAGQWEWMKRYRIWEANRKIFLFPENWLEPEFRDDKTHLYKEMEGTLLQGDVSNDLAEDAFLNYLKKLEELARLDIVAMHLEDDPDPTLRTLHVIGRTYGEPHKYFYRRYVHGRWTPWEPVTAEIEGDHLAPVVWRDRLYLFWVTFMEKAEEPAASHSTKSTVLLTDSVAHATHALANDRSYVKLQLFDNDKDTKLADMTPSEVAGSAMASAGNRTVEVYLHWSEYLQGGWSTRQSGGINAPTPVLKTGLQNFDSKQVFIHVSKEPFEDGEERGVYIHLGGAINQAFYLAGRNSTPESRAFGTHGPTPANAYGGTVRAARYSAYGALNVTFRRSITTEDGKPPVEALEPQSILGQGGSYTLLPCDNDIKLGGPDAEALVTDDPEAVAGAIERGLPEIASLMKPLFYQDNAHTLFIEPSVEERTIEEWQEWVTRTPQPASSLPDRLDDRLKTDIPELKPPRVIDRDDPVWRLPIDRDSRINVQSGHDWLVNPATGLLFEGELIGPGGRAATAAVPAAELAGAIAEGGTPVNVHSGSELASGNTVVALAGDALDRAGLVRTAGALNIVGGSGFNSALAQNFDALKRSGFGG
jgi:hypothetical protein